MIAGIIILIVVLISSVILHEIAHGLTALWFGDNTAKRAGRLTLNPIPHIDPIGSIIVPAVLFLVGGFIFAWAKPVPVDFDNLRPRKLGMICVSLAGVATNFLIAIIAALIFRATADSHSFFGAVLFTAVLINVILGIFNLIPIPPLDGSRLVTMWMPDELRQRLEAMSIFFIFLIFLLIPYLPIWFLIRPVVIFLTGMPL